MFGLNAARPYRIDAAEIRRHHGSDPVQRARDNYRNDPDPSFATYGPKTRREFLDFLRMSRS